MAPYARKCAGQCVCPADVPVRQQLTQQQQQRQLQANTKEEDVCLCVYTLHCTIIIFADITTIISNNN